MGSPQPASCGAAPRQACPPCAVSVSALILDDDDMQGACGARLLRNCGTTHLCRFHREMNRSAPLPMGYPLGSPFSPGGNTSSPIAL